MTSIERTAYPRFKRLITAHELHLFFSPARDVDLAAAALGQSLFLIPKRQVSPRTRKRLRRGPFAERSP
ncbi:hypothetical protein [Streptomyces yerevanensis]|uniref:hypothetical protein n=1 Tax=Streptomyces yerevanensis TaxID=66378 RepID=UPI000523FC78|nr:hypothetical protein [Streptomyces yerevanensis]